MTSIVMTLEIFKLKVPTEITNHFLLNNKPHGLKNSCAIYRSHVRPCGLLDLLGLFGLLKSCTPQNNLEICSILRMIISKSKCRWTCQTINSLFKFGIFMFDQKNCIFWHFMFNSKKEEEFQITNANGHALKLLIHII